MTTVANEALKWKQRQVIEAFASAVNSGTVPDASHLDTGGYHVSIMDLKRFNNYPDYSSSRPGDRPQDLSASGQQLCCADDISMSPSDMARHHGYVKAVHTNRHNDPRAQFISYINTWPGTGDALRYDFVDGSVTRATADHKWHRHGDNIRRFLDLQRAPETVWKAMRATVSVETGQSLAAWLAEEVDVGDIYCKFGDKNAAVRRLQIRLHHSGFPVGAFDNWYQDKTAAALAACERTFMPDYKGDGKDFGPDEDFRLDIRFINRWSNLDEQNAAIAAAAKAAATAQSAANAASSKVDSHLTNHPSGDGDGVVPPHTHSVTGTAG